MNLKLFLFFIFAALCVSDSIFAQDWESEYDSVIIQAIDENSATNWLKSANFYEYAHDLALANQDTIKAINAGIRSATAQISVNELDRTLAFTKSLEHLVNLETSSGQHAEIKYLHALAYYRLSNFELAAEHFDIALNIANPLKDSLIIAKTSLYLGNILVTFAEFERSHVLASDAISIFNDLNETSYIGRANLFKYIIYLYQGNLDDGESYLFNSFNQAKKYDDKYLLNDTYLFLSDFYQRKNDPSRAITFSETGLTLATELNLELSKVRYYNRIGAIYIKLNEPDRALSFLNRAIKFYDSVGSKGLAVNTEINAAQCYILKKDYERAESLIKGAHNYYKDKGQFYDLGLAINNLARINTLTNNYTVALQYLRESLALSAEHNLPRIKVWTLEKLIQLPDAYLSKEEKNALSRELYSSIDVLEPSIQILALKLYSYSFLAINPDSAIYYANEVLDIIENKRLSFSEGTLKANIFAEHATFYNDVASWNATYKKDYSTAFELFESSKSRALLDQLSESRADELLTLSEERQLQLQTLHKNIDQLYRTQEVANEEEAQQLADEISDAELDYEAAIEQIRRNHPAWSSFIYPKTLALEEVQKLCDNTTGVIEYSFLRDGLAIMLITQEEVFYHEIKGNNSFKEDFTKHINDFRSAIINIAPKDSLAILSTPLYETLFSPFKEHLDKLTQLVIVPDGSISLLPLDAIVHNNEYLVNSFTIKYLPSISVFDQIQNPHRSTSVDFFVVAGSGFGLEPATNNAQFRSSFATLPFTLIEADTLAAKFELHTALKNSAVSETGVKDLDLGSFKYLHFATHGEINEAVPNQSGLILSQKKTVEELIDEDGILNATEISLFNLNADMVVLSACNTGSGKVINGEGLLGLQRSFLVAGASSVVASLWSIYDRSTPIFMNTFYNSLIQFEEDEYGLLDKILVWGNWFKPELIDYKTLALRDAKLEMLDHPYYNHPVHWASFVITGK